MSSNPFTPRRPVALWLSMIGIGLLLYSIFTFVPGVLGSFLGLILPGMVAAIVWYLWHPETNPAEMGLVAGLLAGVGAMIVRPVLPPSIEWFTIVDLIPEQYRAMLAILPIPFAYAVVGHLTVKVILRFAKRGVQPSSSES